MDEQRQLLFVNQFLPSNEQQLIDRFRDAASRRVTRPPEVTAVLRNVPIDTIQDIVVGPTYIGVLYTDGQIGRLPYQSTTRPLKPSESPAKSATAATSSGGASSGSGGASGGGGGAPSAGGGGGGSSSAHGSLISRTAKFRRYERVMLATSGGGGGSGARGGRDHRSVIIDRARPMLPASSVPEDLIAQAQVVLQGKSREVIIRELQRTNLNVNEAVNNLLSRDDDDDDGSEGADMCIPEELLSLLDSSHGVLESDLYPPDSFEYLLSSRERRNKAEKDKEKQKSAKPVVDVSSDTESIRRYEVPTGCISEPWEGFDNKVTAVSGPPRFTHIACTQSELLAISTNNKLYGWKWSEPKADDAPHVMYEKLNLAEGETLTELVACQLRVAVMTSDGRLATWLDTVGCGERLAEALFVPPQKLNTAGHECFEQLVVSNQIAVARFTSNVFYWCGLYPVNDRRRIFEKARTKQRKHVTFDTTQIVVGSEVRTKSGPIYSIGCIAANLSGPKPMVGILMENAWSLSEVCRFRLLEPAAYDADKYDPAAAAAAAAAEDESPAESREAAIAQAALASGNRKRPASDDLFSAEPKLREEPWPISDVIFIHEEVQNDTALVTIVDGGYCAVEYQEAATSPTDGFATTASKQLASKGDKDKPLQKARLIRKDELTVVSHKMRYARSPNSIRVEPYRFTLSGSTATKRVISAVADSMGIRALIERRGVASIVRVSVCGRTLTSHSLPLHAPSLHASTMTTMDSEGKEKKPTLINYGDDSILLLRDAHGGLIPLVRDAAAGFKEPAYLQLPASSVMALAVKSVKDKDRPTWAPKANREAVIVTLQGTHARTLEHRLPSLLYAVMCADQRAVTVILDALHNEGDLELSKREIVDARVDGNRNALHAAVMCAFATKNALEADVESPLNALTTSESRASADAVRASLDKKWNEMLRSRSSNRLASAGSAASPGGAGAAAAAGAASDADAATDATQGSVSAADATVILPESQVPEAGAYIKVEECDDDEMALLVRPSPVENPKTRQENAIAIVKMLVTHPICIPFLTELLGTRDIHGQTPFMAAVNHRAYSAARSIFKAIRSLFVSPEGGKIDGEHLIPFIFPAGARPDDSPLFILCYNDTCSFTWTGDEHINQDIFECRTCGLTGSLCCCTECAFTCHRNHDCKLKRTSPTAYCDCWEKACCKALVSGNQHARESLLRNLLHKSNLYTALNGRGEHILLYLARKLARQCSEQWNYTRRARRIGGGPAASGGRADVPEHDLDPPKFARTGMMYCLRSWTVVRSLAMIGVKQMDHSMPMPEELFHLNAQHGASHLDKFMLILLTKCSDESSSMLDALVRTLGETHSRARDSRYGDREDLEEVNFVISRFVRSVARLFILAVVISGVAASTAVSGVVPGKDSSGGSSILDRPSIRSMCFSGIFSSLRKESTKDSKLKNMGNFIVRCKSFFEHFAVFTVHEMAQLADAALAPVRTGILRPCVSLAALLGSTADSLENLEKYINAEPDVTQQWRGDRAGEGEAGGDQQSREQRKEAKEAKKRRKRSSRRDTNDEPPSESVGETGGSERGAGGAAPAAAADSSDSDSDSDSDGDGPSSRRHASQSSALAANEEASSAGTGGNQEAAGAAAAERRAGREFDFDFDSDDSDDEEVESDSEGDRREEDEDEEEEEDREDRDDEDDYDATSEEPHTHGEESRGEEEEEEESREESRVRGIRMRQEDDEEEERRRADGRPSLSEMRRAYGRARRSSRSSSDGEGSGASSPEYSSTSEGDGESRGARGGRRRRRKAAAAAAADAADAIAAVAADAAVVRAAAAGREQANNADAVEQAAPRARAEDFEDRDDDVEMAEDRDEIVIEMGVDVADEQREERGGEEREGSARTRPERAGDAAAATGDVPAAGGAADEDDAPMSSPRGALVANNDAQDRFEPELRRAPVSRLLTRRFAASLAPDRSGMPRNVGSRGGMATRGSSSSTTSASGGGTTSRDRDASRRPAADSGSNSRPTDATRTSTATRGARPRGSFVARRGQGRLDWMSRSDTYSSVTGRTGSGSSSGDEKADKTSKAETAALKEDETPTTFKAGIQLAAAFSFAVRVICDLMPMLAGQPAVGDILISNGHSASDATARKYAARGVLRPPSLWSMHSIEKDVKRRVIDHVRARLDDSWRWLAVVLDHAEAQIKYINAVSSTEEARRKESKEKKKGRRGKSESNDAEPAASTVASSPPSVAKVKRETMACLLGVLRAHSGEAGDDTPQLDLETLRAPALVVDAYLGFVEATADAEHLLEWSTAMNTAKDISSWQEPEKAEEKVAIEGVRHFYQRSNSVSFPGASFTDVHDTLALPCGQALPIVERPQLLTSTVEKEVIFGPPPSTQERTKEEHDKVIRSHGVSHPHNQSLTAPTVPSHRLFVEGQKAEEESMKMEVDDHAVQPIAPVVIPAVASAPSKLDEMAEEKEEKKAAPKKKSPPARRGRKRGAKGETKEKSAEQSSSSPSTSSSSVPPAAGELEVIVIDDEASVPAPMAVVQSPPAGFEKVTYEEILETFKTFREHPLRKLMGRWRFALQLIAKELSADLMDTLGGELSGSRLLRELAGFEMKQRELRARMEKYRATATKDVSLEVHRDAAALIRETCYQLNRTYTRRVAMRGTEGGGSSSRSNAKKDEPLPVLASHKVKVKFVDEPGEGTGVARSYYTALAEALASLRTLPFSDYGYTAGNDEYLYGGPIGSGPTAPAPASNSSSARRIQLIRGRDTFYATVTSSSSTTASGARRRVTPFDRRVPLNYMHPPYAPADMAAAEALNVTPDFLLDLREETYTARRDSAAGAAAAAAAGAAAEKLPAELTDRLYILIRTIYPAAAARLTGMFLDLSLSHIILVLSDPSSLRAYLADAIDLMMQNAAPTDIALLRGDDEKKDVLAAPITSTEADDAPLFFRPSKKAHYSPVPGRLSPARMNAFRNVGRVIGLCLMQCEMFPLRLSRHVLKYILGRPLNWHDFAFYDPQMFESLRKMIVDGCSSADHAEYFDALQMTFTADMPPEATGMPSTVAELIPGGADVPVTKDNIIEYVYRFVEARLLGTTNGRCLAAIRQGVQDVLPQSMLDNLTAEDLRLVLCGTETVSLSLMQSYTAWTDESHAVPETIAKFKQWFWQVAERLSPTEKQDLIFFWTGAPSLPSTEEGFQPLPTIVIRPTDDGFLPTANTCISRLYLPLYTSKRTLTAKLQLAIKAKNFGFV